MREGPAADFGGAAQEEAEYGIEEGSFSSEFTRGKIGTSFSLCALFMYAGGGGEKYRGKKKLTIGTAPD